MHACTGLRRQISDLLRARWTVIALSAISSLTAVLLAAGLGILPQPLAARSLADPLELSWLASEGAADDLPKVDSGGRFAVYIEEGLGRDDVPRGGELWSLPLAGGEPVRLSAASGVADRILAFRISPDGRWVAYAAASGGRSPILALVRIEGGARRTLAGYAGRADAPLSTGDAGAFAFAADSRSLAWSTGEGTVMSAPLLEEVFSNDFESGDSSGWSDTTPNVCPTPTSGPTLHSSVASDEFWSADASPHIVTTNLLVPAAVTLAVEACAEVRIRPGFDITVQGTLIAFGTPTQRITFRRDNPALPWDSIWVKHPGSASLLFVDLSGGGAAGATVIVEGIDSLHAVQPLWADHLKVVGSTSLGIRLFRRAGFVNNSRDLVVTGSGATDPSAPFPVRMSLNTVWTLPTGTYTGNASDQIQVVGEGGPAVEVDETFHDRGVPYQIGGPAGAFGLIVVDGDAGLATLWIEAGVELRFYSQGSNIGGLFVGTSGSPVATGRIVAQGTAQRPILFTGAGLAPAAGDWEGITFFGALAAGNVLDHVQIDAAGDNGGDAGFGCPPPAFPETSGALKIFEQPTSAFLTNSTISRSSTHGIFRAWIGGQVDFMTSNSFVDVAFCRQVLNRPPLPGVCPVDPPCPQ